MIEVMLLGVLVALIKIAELATVIPGTALFALGALVFLFAAIQANFDPREVWDRIEWAADGPRSAWATAYPRRQREGERRHCHATRPAELRGLRPAVAPPGGEDEGRCPRCDEELTSASRRACSAPGRS